MIALFLLLVIAAIALGIVGVVAKGLLYLLFIGIVVLLGALFSAPCGCGGGRAGARPGKPPRAAARFRLGRNGASGRVCAGRRGTTAWTRRFRR